VNQALTTTRLSEISSNKLLVLDFWATWCSPCVAELPKFDSLQDQYRDQIKILPVTTQDEKTVKEFLGRLNKVRKVKLPTVVGYKMLSRLFKHKSLPHLVWIGKDGNVLAITEGRELTKKNIDNVLTNGRANMPLKSDNINTVVNLENGDPVFLASLKMLTGDSLRISPVDKSKVNVQSTLTGYVEGLSSGFFNDSILVGAYNLAAGWLFRAALWRSKPEMLSEGNMLYEISDSTTYKRITGRHRNGKDIASPGLEYVSWLRENGFSYELRIPPALSAKRYDIMLKDLNTYFGELYGIEGVMEERSIRCLALTRISPGDSFVTNGGVSSCAVTAFSLKMVNMDIPSLLTYLGQPLQLHPPTVDETGFKGRLDIELNCQLSNLDDLNKELAKYGLAFVKKDIIRKVAVVKQRK
jgi:thiol-disulfide isomerase/thioredoxin